MSLVVLIDSVRRTAVFGQNVLNPQHEAKFVEGRVPHVIWGFFVLVYLIAHHIRLLCSY